MAVACGLDEESNHPVARAQSTEQHVQGKIDLQTSLRKVWLQQETRRLAVNVQNIFISHSDSVSQK